jgi:arsenate reductase
MSRSSMKLIGAGLVFLGMAATTVPLSAAETNASKPGTVIFVCKHGNVKSQMAAAYFNQLAKEHNLNLTAISRAFTPEWDIPPMITQNLASEGLAVPNPVDVLHPDEASHAAQVISFDEVPQENIGNTKYIHWPDSPLTKKGYWFAMGWIKQHVYDEVDRLVAQKAAEQKAAEQKAAEMDRAGK